MISEIAGKSMMLQYGHEHMINIFGRWGGSDRRRTGKTGGPEVAVSDEAKSLQPEAAVTSVEDVDAIVVGDEQDDQFQMDHALMERALAKCKELIGPRRVELKEFTNKQGFLWRAGKVLKGKVFKATRVQDDLFETDYQKAHHENDERKLPEHVRKLVVRNKKVADVAEHVMVVAAQYIFGEDAEIVFLSDFDDIHNHLDLAVIRRGRNGRIEQVIGLDFTSTPDPGVIQKKYRYSFRGLVRGALATLMYVKTSDKRGPHEYFTAQGVPRGVVGFSPKTVQTLASLLMENKIDQFGADGRRASFIYTLLEEFRGQRLVSERNDKATGSISFATQELQRAEAWMQKIINDNALKDGPQATDRTGQRIREVARSRKAMLDVFDMAKQDVARIQTKREAELVSESPKEE